MDTDIPQCYLTILVIYNNTSHKPPRPFKIYFPLQLVKTHTANKQRYRFKIVWYELISRRSETVHCPVHNDHQMGRRSRPTRPTRLGQSKSMMHFECEFIHRHYLQCAAKCEDSAIHFYFCVSFLLKLSGYLLAHSGVDKCTRPFWFTLFVYCELSLIRQCKMHIVQGNGRNFESVSTLIVPLYT